VTRGQGEQSPASSHGATPNHSQARRQSPCLSTLLGTADNTFVIQPRGTELVEVIAWLLASVGPPMDVPVKGQQTEKADKSKQHRDGVDAMGPSTPLVVIVH
jgi:hypothetical protein